MRPSVIMIQDPRLLDLLITSLGSSSRYARCSSWISGSNTCYLLSCWEHIMLIEHSSIIKEHHFPGGTSRLANFLFPWRGLGLPGATLLLELGFKLINPTLVACYHSLKDFGIIFNHFKSFFVNSHWTNYLHRCQKVRNSRRTQAPHVQTFL